MGLYIFAVCLFWYLKKFQLDLDNGDGLVDIAHSWNYVIGRQHPSKYFPKVELFNLFSCTVDP